MRQYPDHVLASSAVSAPTGSRPPVAQAGDQSTALQILSMAQRTAEEHVATARREAEQIRDQARAAAADIIAEAQA
ncbi:MAG: hypothetical protein KJO75_00345, partial [Dactylosporangium sp.]|nr:hypothetical protein [Dactylosporangium sp.]